MRRANRLFRIIDLLRRERFATAGWLAAALDVSVRTIYRDISDLIRSGVPIEGEAGVGYTLTREFDIPPLMLDREEAEALVLGVRMVRSWADHDMTHAADELLRKVESILPRDLKRKLDATPLFAPRSDRRTRATAWLGELRGAISERRKVRIDYTDASGAKTSRTVLPLGLFFWGATWAVGAWCELRGGFRNFRLDRIEGLEVLPEVAGDDLPNLADYLAEAIDE